MTLVRHGIRYSILTLMMVVVISLAACAPPEPVRIGFIGDLSGRGADLGTGGLSGARMAVAEQNQKGGVNGRPIELVEADDRQDPETSRRAIDRLIDSGVEAIIGPMTSAVAMAIVGRANEAHVVLLSPTVTTNALSGRDDYFFRVIPATRDFVGTNAHYALNTLKLRLVRPIYDLNNRAYSESWLKDYQREFTAGGGRLLDPVAFSSGSALDADALARTALSGKPDGILIIANAVDAAMLCKSLRKMNASIPISTAEWGATERLTTLGGASVEGITMAQFFERNSPQAAYVAFRSTFLRHFGHEPGYPGLYAYDAANTLITALRGGATRKTLKQALLAQKEFAGTQNTIVFDTFGDTRGKTFMVTIKDGDFVPLAPGGTVPPAGARP